MRFVYHPKGCQWCMDYCAHAAQADLLQEESYLKAIRTRDVAIQEESFYRRKADAYLNELDVADCHIKRLEEQLARYKRQLGLDREPQGRSAKRPRYEVNEPELRHEPATSSANTDKCRSTGRAACYSASVVVSARGDGIGFGAKTVGGVKRHHKPNACRCEVAPGGATRGRRDE